MNIPTTWFQYFLARLASSPSIPSFSVSSLEFTVGTGLGPSANVNQLREQKCTGENGAVGTASSRILMRFWKRFQFGNLGFKKAPPTASNVRDLLVNMRLA